MGQHHDSARSLNYTVISIDSPHMRKDSSNYLKFLFAILLKVAIKKSSDEVQMSRHSTMVEIPISLPLVLDKREEL